MDVPLEQLVQQGGTPLFVYDGAMIIQRIKDLAAFDVVRYAQKACSNLAILDLCRRQGAVVVGFRPLMYLGQAEEALRLVEGETGLAERLLGIPAIALAVVGRTEEARDIVQRVIQDQDIGVDEDETSSIVLVNLIRNSFNFLLTSTCKRPFELTLWDRGNRSIYTAVADHWRKTAGVTSITRISVPDETVRLAQLATGEADIADIGLSNIVEAQRIGMVAAGSGTARMVSMMFAGNLWETTHPTTGDPLDIVTYTHDLQWLGNPHSPDDSNNPSGMDDMEQARLVRTALSMAIDRDLINEAALNGLGWPVYIPYFDINNDNWDDKWKVPFDPAGAEALLDQAGFPRDSSGKRFTIPMFAWPIGHFFGEIGDNVSIFWEDIGVKVDVLHYEYAVFRPTLVGRSATQAWTDTGPLEAFSSTPWDWPRGIQMSALARGGKSHGLENPEGTANYLAVSAESDIDERILLNNKFADFLREWVPGMGIVAAPSLLAYNPVTITEWKMELGLRQTTNTPENIKVK